MQVVQPFHLLQVLKARSAVRAAEGGGAVPMEIFSASQSSEADQLWPRQVR